MTLKTKAVFLAAILAAAGGTAAQADDRGGCGSMAVEVHKAVEANPQSPNLEAALDEQRHALIYCSTGYYGSGVRHYSKALELLGAAKSDQSPR